jgi:hypothetical protein
VYTLPIMPPMNTFSPELEQQKPPHTKSLETIKQEAFAEVVRSAMFRLNREIPNTASFVVDGREYPITGDTQQAKACSIKAFGQLGARVALELHKESLR